MARLNSIDPGWIRKDAQRKGEGRELHVEAMAGLERTLKGRGRGENCM